MNTNDKEYYSNLARQLAQTQNYPGVVGAVTAMAEDKRTSATPAKRIAKIIFFLGAFHAAVNADLGRCQNDAGE